LGEGLKVLDLGLGKEGGRLIAEPLHDLKRRNLKLGFGADNVGSKKNHEICAPPLPLMGFEEPAQDGKIAKDRNLRFIGRKILRDESPDRHSLPTRNHHICAGTPFGGDYPLAVDIQTRRCLRAHAGDLLIDLESYKVRFVDLGGYLEGQPDIPALDGGKDISTCGRCLSGEERNIIPYNDLRFFVVEHKEMGGA
jgi:hypothetical protein